MILELAEELMSRGVKVSVYGNFVDERFVKSMLPKIVALIVDSSRIDLQDFDVVYCQHNSISRARAKFGFPEIR